MTLYSGDEFYDDDVTSGPLPVATRPAVFCVQQPDGTFRVHLPDGRVPVAIDEDHARRLVWTFAPGYAVRWDTEPACPRCGSTETAEIHGDNDQSVTICAGCGSDE